MPLHASPEAHPPDCALSQPASARRCRARARVAGQQHGRTRVAVVDEPSRAGKERIIGTNGGTKVLARRDSPRHSASRPIPPATTTPPKLKRERPENPPPTHPHPTPHPPPTTAQRDPHLPTSSPTTKPLPRRPEHHWALTRYTTRGGRPQAISEMDSWEEHASEGGSAAAEPKKESGGFDMAAALKASSWKPKEFVPKSFEPAATAESGGGGGGAAGAAANAAASASASASASSAAGGAGGAGASIGGAAAAGDATAAAATAEDAEVAVSADELKELKRMLSAGEINDEEYAEAIRGVDSTPSAEEAAAARAAAEGGFDVGVSVCRGVGVLGCGGARGWC